jgi:hypothetical protein
MITQEMEIFFCRPGYLRLASGQYSLKDKEKFRHLTNNSLQKYSKNYKKESDIISPKMLEDHVKETLNPNYNFEKDTTPEIIMIIRLLGLILISKRNEIYERDKDLLDEGKESRKVLKWVCDCGKTFDTENGSFGVGVNG